MKWMRVEARRDVDPAQEAPLGRVRIGVGEEVEERVRFERVDLPSPSPEGKRRREERSKG